MKLYIMGFAENQKDIERNLTAHTDEILEHLLKCFIMPQHTATQHWKQEIASQIYKVDRLKSGKKFPSAKQIYNWTYHKKQDLITDPRWFSASVYDICEQYGVELEISPDAFMLEFDAICVKYFKWLSEELSDVGRVSRVEVYQKLDELLANSPI